MRRSPIVTFVLIVICGVVWPAAQTPGARRTDQPARGAKGARPAAQKLPARWWKDATIAARLELVPLQAERIEAVFEAFLPAQRERWTNFRPLEKELDDALRQPHADEQEVIALITRVESRRSELTRHRLIMLFRIQQILTPAQRSKLQALGWPEASPRR